MLVANQRLRPRYNAARVARPSAPGDFLATQKQHESRNAANPVARRQRLLLLGVDLQEPVIGFELGGRSLVSGRHGKARAAPGSPEIYDHRNVVARDVALEGYGIGRDRFPREQLLVAGATLGLPRRPVRGNSVDAAA